jgi:hypothetical protein
LWPAAKALHLAVTTAPGDIPVHWRNQR